MSLWCHDCKTRFNESNLKTHMRCLTIDCNWCRSIGQAPSGYRQIWNHQKLIPINPKFPLICTTKCEGRQYYPCSRCGPVYLIRFDEQSRRVTHPAADCGPARIALLAPPAPRMEDRKMNECIHCHQIIPRGVEHKQMIPLQTEHVHVKLASVLRMMPIELIRLITPYTVSILPCKNFVICPPCGEPILRENIDTHFASTCPKARTCTHCREVCDKDLFELHLTLHPKCKQFETNCVCTHCGIQLAARDRALHELRCPRALTQCTHCKRKKIPNGEMDKHMKTDCPSSKRK
jgi:hypothetical protein